MERTCLRCGSEVRVRRLVARCPTHGAAVSVVRPDRVEYDTYAAMVARAGTFPVHLPWPMGGGWWIADHAVVVAAHGDRTIATTTTIAGRTKADGSVDVTIITEEHGVGYGARVTGAPGPLTEEGPDDRVYPVPVDGDEVVMWPFEPDGGDDLLAKIVFVGNVDGRWLWVMVRPASAGLMPPAACPIVDVTARPEQLRQIAYGGPAPRKGPGAPG